MTNPDDLTIASPETLEAQRDSAKLVEVETYSCSNCMFNSGRCGCLLAENSIPAYCIAIDTDPDKYFIYQKL